MVAPILQNKIMSRHSNYENTVIPYLKRLSEASSSGATEQTALDILAALTDINTNLTDNTNALLAEIRDSNVAQEALITSTNSLLTQISTDIAVLHADNIITNQELADINTELNSITTVLNNISAQDASFHTDLLDCLDLIKTSLDNIDNNTDELEVKLDTLITQTDQVESLLSTINDTLNTNSTLNVSKLEEIRVLLAAIDANTDSIETQLTSIISEHDQTQVILNSIKIKPNETEILVCIGQEGAEGVDEQVTEEVVEFTSYVSTSSNLTTILGFTTVSGPGNTTPAAIGSQNPVYFNTPVELSQGVQPLESDKDYYYSIIDEIINQSNQIGINFPNKESWSYFVSSGSLRFQIKFYITKADFNDATAFLNTYKGSITDTPDNNLYVRGVSESNTTYTKYGLDTEDTQKTGSLVKEFDEFGAEIVSNRKFYIKGVEITTPPDWSEGSCQIDTTSLIEQNNSLLENVYAELQAINGNTDNVESDLDSLQAAINTQTNTLQTAINLVQQEINTASQNEVAELQAIQTDLTDILTELLSINSNIQAGNITINNILNAVNELLSVTATKLDTINQSIQDNGLTLEAINVNIQKVVDAIEQLSQDLLNSLEDVKTLLQTLVDKPNETEVLICSSEKETLSLVKEFDEAGDEIVANRKFYNSGVEIAEPTNWEEGSCAIFRLEELISLTQAGNATTNEISSSLNDVVSLLQNIDKNTDEVEDLLKEIDTSIDAVIPYIDDVEKLLESLNNTNEKILNQVTPKGATQFITKLNTTGQTVSFGAGKVNYVDVIIVGSVQTGIVEVDNAGNDLIEMSTEGLRKYERNFETYSNKVNPHDITVTYLGSAKGYMLVEFGLV